MIKLTILCILIAYVAARSITEVINTPSETISEIETSTAEVDEETSTTEVGEETSTTEVSEDTSATEVVEETPSEIDNTTDIPDVVHADDETRKGCCRFSVSSTTGAPRPFTQTVSLLLVLNSMTSVGRDAGVDYDEE